MLKILKEKYFGKVQLPAILGDSFAGISNTSGYAKAGE